MTNFTATTDHDLSFIYPIFERHAHRVDLQDREDVLSEVLVAVVEKLRSGTAVENLVTYVFSVVKFKITSYLRMKTCAQTKAIKYVHYCDGIEEDGVAEGSYNASDNDASYLLCEFQIDYEASRSKFSPNEQKVVDFMLYSSEQCVGMKPSAIATHLGLDHAHGCNALRKLKNLFLQAS